MRANEKIIEEREKSCGHRKYDSKGKKDEDLL